MRTLAPGSSSMAITSDAGRTSKPWSVPSSSGRPTSTTGTPTSAAARTAPRRSPPALCRHPSHRPRWGAGSCSGSARLRQPGGRGTSRSSGTRHGEAWPRCSGGRRCGRGAPSVQALARRLRLFAFDVFFLGTAMSLLSLTPLRVARSSVGSSLALPSPTGDHGGTVGRHYLRSRASGERPLRRTPCEPRPVASRGWKVRNP